MRNKILLLILFPIVIGSISAEEKIFTLQIASITSGLNLSNDLNYGELTIEILNMFIENQNNRFGFKISPFSLRMYFNDLHEYNITELNFLNFCSHYNLLNNYDIIFGPFVSTQYLSIRNWQSFDFKNITLNTGVKTIVKDLYFDVFDRKYNFLAEMELGYRYNYYIGHRFYLTMTCDLIGYFIFIGKVFNFFHKIREMQ